MSNRTLALIAVMVFAVTLAIVIGTQIPAQAMPIVFGVAVGVAVGVPTSVLVAMLTRQAMLSLPDKQDLYVHTGGNGNGSGPQRREATHPSTPQVASSLPPAESGRQFTVVGGAAPPLLEDD